MGHLASTIRAARTPGPIAFLAALALGTSAAFGGSMPLVWTPATDPDIAGYKVFYGTAQGGYPSSVDVGNVTSTTLTGLNDCTRYYVAIKAYDGAGNQSTSFSNELSGLPATTVASSTPASAERGQSLTVTVSGANFDAGAGVTFSDPKITVLSTTFVSCNQVRAQIAIASDAILGAASLDVMNPDRTFATRAAALGVLDVSVPGPTANSPAAGATGVALPVQPTVTFSEAMDPSSITSGSVQLLRPDGTAVVQGSGSPSLDPTGRVARIVPAANLQYQTAYRVRVIGGPTGALDAQGTPLGATFTQSPGFTTIAAPAPTVIGTSPASGATGVALAAQPTVTFTQAMDADTITASTVKLLLADGTAVAQASGSPSLDATGAIARITPASPLAFATVYRIQVVGGSGGATGTLGTALATTFTQPNGFTTISAPAAPTVTGTSPVNGATGVALSAQPSATFSTAMDPASITTSTVRLLLADGTAVAQASGSPSLDATGTIARITPAAVLAYGTAYRIQVVGGSAGASDTQGTELASTFTQPSGFSTIVAPAPPAVSATSPANGASSVAIATQPTVTFSKTMDPATITASTVKLLRADGTSVAQASGSPSLDATGTIARIAPQSALAYATAYRIQVVGGSGGAADTLGNDLVSTFTQPSGFTTVPAPVAPTVLGTSPANGATGVTIAILPTVTFSEAMDPQTITGSVKLLRADGTAVAQAAGSPSLDATGTIARIAPASPLAYATSYRLQVVGGSGGAADAQGTPLASAFTQSTGFTTIPTPAAPAVIGTSPANGATAVPVSVQPTATFSRAMSPATITASTVKLLRSDGTAVTQASGSPSLDATGTIARIAPATVLANGTAYRIQVIGGSGGAADAQGTPLAATFTQPGLFTTTATTDTTRPSVVSAAPRDGVSGVSMGAWPTITFSEPLLPSSVNPSMVQLLRADGSGIPQAMGSPTLDATGKIVTIIPAEALPPASTFRVKVYGGTIGVQDLAGNLMATTYLMTPGFTTEGGAAPPAVQSTDPADGATGASTDVDPAVVFNKPVAPASVHAGTVMLVLQDGTPVVQAAGSPSLDPNGLTARIVPASPLVVGTVYFIRVVGGAAGIKDLSGAAMGSTYTQTVGFQVKAPPGQVNNLRRKDKK